MPNVAVVVLDTVRADSFADQFGWVEGCRFTDAYSTSHWTIPAHASLFTGAHPSAIGVHAGSPTLDCPDPTLAEAFRDAGYATQCLSANTQLNQYDGWRRGFQEFDGTATLSRTDEEVFDWGAHIEQTEPGARRYLTGLLGCLSEPVATRRSLAHAWELYQRPSYDGGALAVRDRLEAAAFDTDSFLFVNLMDAHTPYRPPEGQAGGVSVVAGEALAGTVSNPALLRAAYRESVSHLSAVYRDIHEQLLEDFEYVVTLSDHGEHLGEDGMWNHSLGLAPELTRIPLVISGEDIEPGSCDVPVNLRDVHRTICDLGYVQSDSEGRNLLGPLTARELRTEYHGLLPFHRRQFERYDVPTALIDRWEGPLYGSVTERGGYCYQAPPDSVRVVGDAVGRDPHRRLAELAADIDLQAAGAAEPAVSESVRDRLEELGYA